MPFTDKPQVFNAAINALTFGEAGREVTIGGSNVYPLTSWGDPPMWDIFKSHPHTSSFIVFFFPIFFTRIN